MDDGWIFHFLERTGLDVISQVRETHPNLVAILMAGNRVPEAIYHDLDHFRCLSQAVSYCSAFRWD